MFKLEFAIEGAAFENAPELEVAHLVEEVARHVKEGFREGLVRDGNGNKLGSWVFNDE